MNLITGGGGGNTIESVVEGAGEFVCEAQLSLVADLKTQTRAGLIGEDKVRVQRGREN